MKQISCLLFFMAVLGPTAASAQWEPVGPEGGYIQAIAADPAQPSRMYAVVYELKVFNDSRVLLSTDGGESWREHGVIDWYSITSLVVDPHDSDILYAAGGAQQIYRSTDAGATWASSALPYRHYAREVCADPFVPGRAYAAGYGYVAEGNEPVAFITTDCGASWTPQFIEPGVLSYGYSCVAHPVDSGTVFWGGSGGKVYRTTDGGLTWQTRNSGILGSAYTLALDINPGDPGILLAATRGGGIYRTTDAGGSWAVVQSGTMFSDLAFSGVEPAIAYAGYDRLYVSTDTGATWAVASPGLQMTALTGLLPHPDSGNSAYACGNLGVWRTGDAGANWEPSNSGMRVAVVSCITVNQQDPQRLYLEVSENGVFKSEDAGNAWTRCSDFLECGNVCAIGVIPGAEADVLIALEGSG